MSLNVCSRPGLAPAGVLAAAMAALLLATVAPRTASSAEGPFSALQGSWNGGGVIKKSNGSTERIRCRASYAPSGVKLQLSLRCASDSYTFNLGADVAHDGRSGFSGSWSEETRGVSGNISGTATNNGRRVQGTASAAAFSAQLSLSTNENRQSVRILSPGAEVPEVDISLERR